MVRTALNRTHLWPHASDALGGADFTRSRFSGAYASCQLAANAAFVAAVPPECRSHAFGVASGDMQVTQGLRRDARTFERRHAGPCHRHQRRPRGAWPPPWWPAGATSWHPGPHGYDGPGEPPAYQSSAPLVAHGVPSWGWWAQCGWVSSTRCAWRSPSWPELALTCVGPEQRYGTLLLCHHRERGRTSSTCGNDGNGSAQAH
jgi:hypothetical protein